MIELDTDNAMSLACGHAIVSLVRSNGACNTVLVRIMFEELSNSVILLWPMQMIFPPNSSTPQLSVRPSIQHYSSMIQPIVISRRSCEQENDW
jgi:hypothetical protein